MMRSPGATEPTDSASEIDMRALGLALKRRRRAIVMSTLLAFMSVAVFVNVVTPRYTAETQVLLENQETFFTRPDRANLQPEQAGQLDAEAVASQVQLISSRDIARRAIKQLHLTGNPEFDSLADGLSPLTRVLILLGVASDPTRESVESRIVTKFLDKLNVYSPPKTRVIAIQFTSRDPELAARAANTVAQLYLLEQSAAKRGTARMSAEALAAQIADLRPKLLAADDEREKYRLQSGLFAGSNNMTISGQQLADINSDLSKARSTQADAQAKASMIRELIRDGKAADVTEVINNDIVRRVSDQRVTAQAELARESRTLLPGHPRIKELTAQLSEFDLALKMAAKKAATTLENEAKIAGQRVANLEDVLTQQKRVAGVANTDEVHMRALERISQSYKDQLDSSSAKYQEALARQSSTATPADARIISSASQPQEPTFPKKVPFIVFGTVATLVLAAGFAVASELLSGHAYDPEAAPVREKTSRIEDALASQAAPVSQEPSRFQEPPRVRTTAAFQDPDLDKRTEPALKARRAWSYADDEPNSEAMADPVFAPVTSQAGARPSADGLRTAAAGGMLAATYSYLKMFGRSAAASREDNAAGDAPVPATDNRMTNFGWDSADLSRQAVEEPRQAISPSTPEPDETEVDIASLANRIVTAHVPGRGLHIVGTCVGHDSGADVLIDLGRTLASKGRAIIVDLNRTPASLAALAADNGRGQTKIMKMQGLAELLAGDSTFAEVIHRDLGSRLHYIPTGLQEADFRDFDLILDALSETYDFIVLLTPAFPQSEIAKIMAPYADFVVLAAIDVSGDTTIAALESELIQAGAREVLIAAPVRPSRQDVA